MIDLLLTCYFLDDRMIARYIFFGLLLLTFFPFIESSMALVMGILYGSFFQNQYTLIAKKYSKKLLNIAIIGLGFGLNLHEAVSISKDGFVLTLVSILSVFTFGYVFFSLLNINKNTSLLITSGTAICGGSAIAAISSVLQPKTNQITIALAAVFILNALALLIFPFVGHFLELSQYQFGLWSAIAIHDTSSVVGAAKQYGETALHVATTVKLSRTLWIFPLAIIIGYFNKKEETKYNFPYFIFGFVATMLIATYFPQGEEIYAGLQSISKQLMVVSLFLIGSMIDFKSIKQAGAKTMTFAVLLWLLISVLSLVLILFYFS